MIIDIIRVTIYNFYLTLKNQCSIIGIVLMIVKEKHVQQS